MTVDEMKYLDLIDKLKDLELAYLHLKAEKDYLSYNPQRPYDVNEPISYKLIEQVVQTKYSGTQFLRFVVRE